MNSLHLFAGIGGGILADKILGHRIVGAVEIDSYCRDVLKQRQEEGFLEPFPIFEDVRTFDGTELKDLLTSYAEASLARIFLLPAKVKGLKEVSPVSSTSLLEYVGLLDQNTSSSKTPQLSCQEDSTKSSKRLPSSGTMRNGVLYQREPLERAISVIGGGAFVKSKNSLRMKIYFPKQCQQKSLNDLWNWMTEHGYTQVGAKKILAREKRGFYHTPTAWDGQGRLTEAQLRRDNPNLCSQVELVRSRKGVRMVAG
jgi:hypothetical protein